MKVGHKFPCVSPSVVSRCGSLPGLAGRMCRVFTARIKHLVFLGSLFFLSPCTLSVVKPSLGLDGLYLTLHHLLQVTCNWSEWEAYLFFCGPFFRKSELDWHFPYTAARVNGAWGSAFCTSTQHPSLSKMALVSMLMISDMNLHLNRQRCETSIRRCRESQVVSGLLG